MLDKVFDKIREFVKYKIAEQDVSIDVIKAQALGIARQKLPSIVLFFLKDHIKNKIALIIVEEIIKVNKK